MRMQPLFALACFVPLAVQSIVQQCVSPGNTALDMYMPFSNKNVSVPPIPQDTLKYAYATENALVAIPAKCKFGIANLDEKLGGRTGMAFIRISNPAEYAALASLAGCSCGLVVSIHGTGGATGEHFAYMRMFAALNYVVITPDSQAMPVDMGLKGRSLLKTTDISVSDYWGLNNPYNSSCDNYAKPFCYSTQSINVLNDGDKYKDYVERTYLIRKKELDYLFEQTTWWKSFRKTFLIGRSEGGMVAARYHHAELDARLSGRIVLSWSCDYNYFVSCAANAKVCGDQCNKTVPQLNVIGGKDDYFSTAATSIASQVANDTEKGYGGPITGNCRATYDSQGFQSATVVVFPDALHPLIDRYDNVLRSIFADFVYSPTSPGSWKSLQGTCSLGDNKVYNCTERGAVELTIRNINRSGSWNFSGAVGTCPVQQCVPPGNTTLDMYLPSLLKTVSVPPIPQDTFKYAYATENALVAIPAKCKFGIANLDEKLGGRTGMAFIRISNPEQYAALENLAGCSCGLVVSIHGSGGATGEHFAYMRMFAALNYVVITPDSQAMPVDMGLKGRSLLKTADISVSDYWGPNNPYNSSCDNYDKPFCYSTLSINVLNDGDKYKDYVERTYLIRKKELDYLFEQTKWWKSFRKTFLIGRSEGGMVAARYHHEQLDARLSGRIVLSWSCDYNYFVSCAANAKVCGDLCNKTVPQLNVIGGKDNYFSTAATSIASQVAKDTEKGYGGPITGNCRVTYDSQGFQSATVVVFPDALHPLIDKYDNVLRSIFADFVSSPTSPGSWKSLNGTCNLGENKVYSCTERGTADLTIISRNVNVSGSWNFTGAVDECDSKVSTVSSARVVFGSWALVTMMTVVVCYEVIGM